MGFLINNPKSQLLDFGLLKTKHVYNYLAWVAGGIVGARNNVLTAEPRFDSGTAKKRAAKPRGEWEGALYFLAASPLTISGSTAKTLFRVPAIPPATQADNYQPTLSRKKRQSKLSVSQFSPTYPACDNIVWGYEPLA